MHHGNIDQNTAKGLIELKKRINNQNVAKSVKDKTMNIEVWPLKL